MIVLLKIIYRPKRLRQHCRLLILLLMVSDLAMAQPGASNGASDSRSHAERRKAELEAVENLKTTYDTIHWNSLYVGIAGLGGMLLADALRMPYVRTFGNAVAWLASSVALGAYGASQHMQDKQDPESLTAALEQSFRRASGQGAIGEASNLFLIPEGFYVHPVYNDVNGNTDKLLTASLKLGLLRTWDHWSLETIAYWRLLTPSFKPEFNVPDLRKPVGRYADWAELKTSLASTVDVSGIPLRTQLSLGYNDIGDKGGKEVHVAIHRLTRNSIENLEYTNQPEGRFLTLGGEVGVSIPMYMSGWGVGRGLLSVAGERSKIMDELGLRWNMAHVILPEFWEYGIEIRGIRQLASQAYERIRPIRHEGAIGVRVMRYFTPTIKYVSPYLYGDDVGQTYFDLLHYNFIF